MYNFQVWLRVALCNVAGHGLDATAVKQRNREMVHDAQVTCHRQIVKGWKPEPYFCTFPYFLIDSVAFLVLLR
jgi:hypothetical protein